MTLVSAIIPTYRRPREIERSVNSVLAQTWRPLELIVIDDGSGDETPQVLRSFEARAKAADVTYQWATVPNGGAGPARNAGMQRATGDYLAFLDDDDEWVPEKTSIQVAAMQAQPQAGASFGLYVHDGERDRPKPKPEHMKDGWTFDTLCSGETRAHLQTFMITRAAYAKVGGMCDARNWQDTEWHLRIALEFPFVAVNEVLTVIHTVESSISREAGLEGDLKRDRRKLELLDQLIANHGRHARFNLESTKLLRARIYDEHIKHLLWLGRVKDAQAAWEEALKACGDQPLLLKIKRKLTRAKIAKVFGRRLRKPD